MKKIALIFILVTLLVTLYAQDKKYSYKKAIAASLLFPGGGEIYSKRYKTAGFLIASEISVIFSYFRMKSEEKYATDSYKIIAWTKAGIPTENTKEKYDLAAKWFSSDDYNNYLNMNARNYYLIYLGDQQAYETYLNENLIPEDEGWNWKSDENWKKYKTYRKNTQNYKIYANLIASGFIINRLVSLMDSIISIKKLNKLKLTATPDFKKKGMKINYVFKF